MLDIQIIRENFPALDKDLIYFDNPGGSQIVRHSLERIRSYLVDNNANRGGALDTSRRSDAIQHESRCAVADFINANLPEEIVFGVNTTTLTYIVSRAIANTLNAGDSLVVTRLNHDTNLTPWAQIAQDRKCKVRWVDFNTEDGTLVLDELEASLDSRPKLVAIGYASNALGMINPVQDIVRMAHSAGALVYIDAVQYAPNGPIDVQSLNCDFLTFSMYKLFGPHVGILYGKHDLLDELPAYKVRPAPDTAPFKFETGTQSHEGMAGTLGTLEYLSWLGESFGQIYTDKLAHKYTGHNLNLKKAMIAIRAYEYEISKALLDGFAAFPRLNLFGLSDKDE